MKRIYLLIWAASLLLLILAALGIESPGYMDADYYFATAQQVASGNGFLQPFIWQYLDNPAGIPHASHGYWMPLTTLAAALPMWVFKSTSFRAAQLPFILLVSLMPVASVYAAFQFHGRRKWAILSGLLALFSGFYFTFFLTTDNFVLYAWLGGTVLWLAAGLDDESALWKWGALGGLVGLAHLTRADGILLLIPVLWSAWRARGRRAWLAVAVTAIGLTLIELPWWLRNLETFGSLLSPSSGRVLWLTSYNELFAYPSSRITMDHWLQSGLASIFQVRLQALWVNIQHALAEPGMVLLWPFVIIAIRKHWRHRWVRLSVLYFLLMFAGMTVVFPFAGMRGGVFHSSTAVLPLVWVLAPSGLMIAIGWAARRRGWHLPQAERIFSGSAVGMMAILTLGLYVSQVMVPTGSGNDWDASFHLYRQVGDELRQYSEENLRVAVNNPPGFWLATNLEAVVIPDGDEATLRRAIEDFDVDILLLDRNVPSGLEGLYLQDAERDWLRVIESIQDPLGDPVWILEVLKQ